VPKSLGAYLRDRLDARHMSLRAAARACGVSHSTLSRLLAGRLRPSAGLLLAIADALQEPAAAMFAHAGLPPLQAGELPALDPGVAAALDRASLRQDLTRLAADAQSPEAAAAIEREFEGKLRVAGAAGPAADRLLALRRVYTDAGAPRPARAMAGGALLYFLRGADRIDDARFPYGYLDDVAVADMAWSEIESLIQTT